MESVGLLGILTLTVLCFGMAPAVRSFWSFPCVPCTALVGAGTFRPGVLRARLLCSIHESGGTGVAQIPFFD